jgi:hypothetical protein
MGLRGISVGADFQDGINFHDDYKPEVVAEALGRLYRELSDGGNSCYCLQLQVAKEGETHFRPFGAVLCPHGVAEAPSRIPLQWLVPDLFTWPILGVAEWDSDPARGKELGLVIGGVKRALEWHVQMRVQEGSTYRGYFKIAGVKGAGTPVPPDDRTLRAAFYSTKLYVASLLSDRAIERTLTSKEFQWRLQTTRRAIAGMESRNQRLALKHVADMLTSHLGAGWNRAACYCPVDANTLRCLWAQGGGRESSVVGARPTAAWGACAGCGGVGRGGTKAGDTRGRCILSIGRRVPAGRGAGHTQFVQSQCDCTALAS